MIVYFSKRQDKLFESKEKNAVAFPTRIEATS